MIEELLETDFDTDWSDVVKLAGKNKWSSAGLTKIEAVCVEFQSDPANAMYWRYPQAVLAVVGDVGDRLCTVSPLPHVSHCHGALTCGKGALHQVRWKAECGMDELETEITDADLEKWDKLKGHGADLRYKRITGTCMRQYEDKAGRHAHKAAVEMEKRTKQRDNANKLANRMAVPSQEVWWQFWAIFLDAVQNLKATQCAHWVCLVCYFWSSYGTFGLSSAKNHRFGPCAHAPHSRLVFVHELVDNSLPPATCACEQSAPALGPPTKPPAGLNTPAGCCRQCGCTPKPPRRHLWGDAPRGPPGLGRSGGACAAQGTPMHPPDPAQTTWGIGGPSGASPHAPAKTAPNGRFDPAAGRGVRIQVPPSTKRVMGPFEGPIGGP